MDLEFGQLKKADYKKAIQFAIEGMHFNWYLDNKLLQNPVSYTHLRAHET